MSQVPEWLLAVLPKGPVAVLGDGAANIAQGLCDLGWRATACSEREDAIRALNTVAKSLGRGSASLLITNESKRIAALVPRLGWSLVASGEAATVWSRHPESRRAMGWIGEEHDVVMRQLFEAVFGHAMSAALWQWKYGDGRGVGLGLWIDGELVAHYGGNTREVLAFGQAVRACQVCDVMVAPKVRGTLARQGPLAIITASFLEHQIGYEQPHLIGFGFPSDRHFGVAEHLGLYQSVDEMIRFEWPAAAGAEQLCWRWRVSPLDWQALREGGAENASVRVLWQRMAAAFVGHAIGVRSPAWLLHRYVQRPGARYEAWALRSRRRGRLEGMVVLLRHADRLELLDLVAAPSRFGALVRMAQGVAARATLPLVEMWITASQRVLFDTAGTERPRVERLGIQVPANAHSNGPAPAAYRGRWFLMSGDTDFR